MTQVFRGWIAALPWLLAACGDAPAPHDASVTPSVSAALAQAAKDPALLQDTAMADAQRGLIARPEGVVRTDAGAVLWDFDAFAFIDGAAPASVHPSLWRQARLNNQIGLFKVAAGIWQVRGFDLANLTLIEGERGWIVVDALTSRETAQAAMAFARQHLGERPVSALIFTHSHADHFGGALGIVSADEAAQRGIPIIAPHGFMDEATSENLLMGVAMGRRASYMYGRRLPRSAQGLVDNGLGKAVAFGQLGLIAPTREIDARGETLVLDGVEFVFHDVAGTEAPAELVFSIPARKAFCGSELMAQTLHNLYTLRGAKVRDALKWARLLDASLAWSAEAEVLFNQHHWPVWGRDDIRSFIELQRDTYKYLHDQTVRAMNAGFTASEIAETLQLPDALQSHLAVRGYYGTVRHNVKAVYQHYLGWFDAHPAHLDPLPPREAASRYLALAGGATALMTQAQQAFDGGEFRWAAELLSHLVIAEPEHAQAKALLARSFEQLGYLAESAPWRNFYLSGALELREGPPREGLSRADLIDLFRHTPTERFLEAMAASIDGEAAADLALVINLHIIDGGENHVLRIGNGVLHHHRAAADPAADATLQLSKEFFLQMMTGQAGAKDLLLSDQVEIEGSTIALGRFLGLIEKADGTFPIVTRP